MGLLVEMGREGGRDEYTEGTLRERGESSLGRRVARVNQDYSHWLRRKGAGHFLFSLWHWMTRQSQDSEHRLV